MLSETALVQALSDAGLSAPVRFDEVTRSTNATALEMAQTGAPEWTLVAAGHQTAGRGRLGRDWVDRPGSALMFSLVLRPDLSPDRAGLISLLAGAAMAGACREACGVEARCKWPNDILVGDHKAGGILAESTVAGGRVEHVVLGIGVNLGPPPPGVADAAGLDGCDAAALLTAFLRVFRGRYQPAHPAFAGAVLAEYREVSATLGTRVRAANVAGGTVEGRAVDVDERGGLVVESEGRRETVAFGEIEHLARAPGPR